jgi:hypothetical protein
VSRFSSYVVAWADPHSPAPGEPVIERLRAAAQSQSGALFACGGAQDVVETDSRRFPSWLAIAGFSEDEAAKTWVTLAENHLPDTALLIPGQAEPVEWPPERAAEKLELPHQAVLVSARSLLLLRGQQLVDLDSRCATPDPGLSLQPNNDAGTGRTHYLEMAASPTPGDL